MTQSLGETFEHLLGDFSKLSARIRTLEPNIESCSDQFSVKVHYVSFRQGEPTVDDLVDVLNNHVIAFCLPKFKIRDAREEVISTKNLTEAQEVFSRIHNEACGYYIRAAKGSSRSGEGGEVLLYMLNEWILGAPQIVSKMFLKTNYDMPVHGNDGIHARYDTNTKELILYWGESKVQSTLPNALASALGSIEEYINNEMYKHEIKIVNNHYDFDNASEEAKKEFLAYFHPYKEQSNKRRVVYSCLLSYNHSHWREAWQASGKKYEEQFQKDLRTYLDSYIPRFEKALNRRNLSHLEFHFFVFPFPNVQEFRDKFQKKIGYK